MKVEVRVSEMETELRALRRTVAAMAPTLAASVVRELTARGALLVVKAPQEEMSQAVAKSVALAMEENESAMEEEEKASEALAIEENESVTEGGKRAIEQEGKENATLVVEESAPAKGDAENKSPAVVESESESSSESESESESEEEDEEEDEEVDEEEEEAKGEDVQGAAVEGQDERAELETSQESSGSGSSSGEISVCRQPMPLSLTAFEDALSCGSRPSTVVRPLPSPTLMRVPSRPPAVAQFTVKRLTTAPIAPKKQLPSKSKLSPPAVLAREPTRGQEPVRVQEPKAPAPAYNSPSPRLDAQPRAGMAPPKQCNKSKTTPQAIITQKPSRSQEPVPLPMPAPTPSHIPPPLPRASAQPSGVARAEMIHLPEEFEVPTKDTVAVAWERWCCGDAARGYPPFRSITTKQVAVKAVSRRLSDLRCAMQPIEAMAKSNGMWRPDFTPHEAAAVFAELEDHLPFYIPALDGRKRKKEIAWSTALNNMRKKRKQQIQEDENQALV